MADGINMKLKRGAIFCFFLTLVVTYGSALTVDVTIEASDMNNLNNSKSVDVDVIQTKALNIVYVPINYSNLDDYKWDVRRNSEFLLATYPINESNLNEVITENIIQFAAYASLDATIKELMKQTGLSFLLSGWSFDRVVGVFPENGLPFGNRGFSLLNSNLPVLVSPRVGPEILSDIFSHEIGHTFGVCDEYDFCEWAKQDLLSVLSGGCPNNFPYDCPGAICIPFVPINNCTSLGSTDIKGFWVDRKDERVTMPTRTFYSIMGRGGSLVGVCGENNTETCRWVTNEIYSQFLPKFSLSGTLFSQPFFRKSEAIHLSPSSQSLLVSGSADTNGWVGFDESYVLNKEAMEEIPIGPYSLKLLDANNNILLEQSFGVSFTLLSDPPIDLNTTGFAFVVPFPAGAKKIRIDFNGETRAERLVSANAPSASFVSPAGGEEWSSRHLVKWNASDADGDKLSFVLQYSADNGLTWNPIAIDLNEESYELNAGYLPPADNYKLKVIATDSVLTGEATSNTFTVRNPDIDVQPWRIDFGEVEQGTSVSQDINLANAGNADLQVYDFNAPENVSVSGLSLPLTLLLGQSTQFRVDLNTAVLEGSISKEVVFYSNDPNESEKHFFIEGRVFVPETMDGNLHLADMNSYLKEQVHYSGVASAQMILNYMREAAGYPQLSQDIIYSYGHKYNLSDNNDLLELDANAMNTVLGHFDPYDFIISEPYDGYDSLADGNPYQGYSFSIDTFDANTDSNAVTNYMSSIAHWMAYPVTRKAWWLDEELVAKPNTPAAIPLYGSYAHWAVVNGFAASGNPVPNPSVNPWQSSPVTIYGFWLTDPAEEGIGQHVFVTAADANAVYFKPMDSNDSFHGKYLQIAEPPVLPPEESGLEIEAGNDFKAEVLQPVSQQANLRFVGVESEVEPEMRVMSIDSGAGVAAGKEEPMQEKNSWRDLVDSHLLLDEEAIAAFEDAEMSEPMLVQELDKGQNYYLVPFRKQGLTTGVIMLDAEEGYFKQASWTPEPEQYPTVGEQNAVSFVKREINPLPTESLVVEFSLFEEASAQLAWQPNNYSQSPFKPFWVIEMEGGKWIATQEGKLYEILPTTSIKVDTQVIEIAAIPPESNGFTSLGKYFEIINPNIENGAFSATLTFFYNDADNDGIVDETNIEEKNLNIYYSEEGKAWTEIAESERNTEANTIKVTVNHFSLFALMAKEPEQQIAADSSPNTAPQGGSGGSSGGGTISPQKNAVEGTEKTPDAQEKDIEENKELNEKAVEEKKTAIEAAEERSAAKEDSKQELQATPTGLILLGGDKAIAMLLGCFLIALVLSTKIYLIKKKKGSCS